MTCGNEPRPFRILSIDGGGIKGAYSAAVLAELERRTGQRCVDHFDLIAGTSTGGIIAIGLGLGLTATEIRDFYVEKGDDIFPSAGVVTGKARALRQIVRPKYSVKKLRSALQEKLGDSVLGDSKCRLVIPAYDVTLGRIYLFKTAHHPHLAGIGDQHIPARDVALATSAAPTYFRSTNIAKHDGAHYVDGGVWANCPVMTAVTEAIHFCGQQPSDIDVLSIGTTAEPFKASSRHHKAGFAGWGLGLVDILMDGPAEASVAQAGLIVDRSVLRINDVVSSGRFSLDDSSEVNDLIALGRATGIKRDNVAAVEKRFLNGVHAAPFVPVV